MKHDYILEQLLLKAKGDSNTLGFLVFGSVSLGTHNERSDIDLIEILREHDPSSGWENTMIDGISVFKIFGTYKVLAHDIDTVPYLFHILGNTKLLFDRENTIQPLLKKINDYFAKNPEMEEEWNRYYKQFRKEKSQFGYDKTGIINVLNELENRYSGGKITRSFLRTTDLRTTTEASCSTRQQTTC